MDSEALDGLTRVPHGGTTDPHVLDFSANTNPESPSGVAAVYEAALSASRRYPADDYCEFRAAAAEYVGCDPDGVVPMPGALPGIRLAFGAILDPEDSVLLPEPSFGEYAHEVRLQGAEPTFVGHDAIVDADPAGHDLVVVCNPNNPTGEAYPTDDLLRLADRCRAADATLLVDEAFLDYTDRPTLAGREGVVVARSLTKVFGFPGLRAGFLVATGDLGDRLQAARPSWALSTPAAAVGAHCLDRPEFVERTRRRTDAERERMADRLATRFDVYPSDAPFLLFDASDADPDELIDAARREGIVIRDARTFRTLDNHLRVAVKRPEENDALLAALNV